MGPTWVLLAPDWPHVGPMNLLSGNIPIYSQCYYLYNSVTSLQCFAILSMQVSTSLHDILKYTHYDDVIMTILASQITSLPVVCSIVYSGVNQRKHQSSASLAFVRKIHRGPVNFPHKWPVTRKMFPFDDVIMFLSTCQCHLFMKAYFRQQGTPQELLLLSFFVVWCGLLLVDYTRISWNSGNTTIV